MLWSQTFVLLACLSDCFHHDNTFFSSGPWGHFLLIHYPSPVLTLYPSYMWYSVVNHFNNTFAWTLNSLILCFCVRGSHKVSTVDELSLLHLFQSSWAIKSTTVYGNLVSTNVIVIKLGSTIFLLDLPTSRISKFKLSPFSSRPLSLLPPHSINSSLLPGSYFT